MLWAQLEMTSKPQPWHIGTRLQATSSLVVPNIPLFLPLNCFIFLNLNLCRRPVILTIDVFAGECLLSRTQFSHRHVISALYWWCDLPLNFIRMPAQIQKALGAFNFTAQFCLTIDPVSYWCGRSPLRKRFC